MKFVLTIFSLVYSLSGYSSETWVSQIGLCFPRGWEGRVISGTPAKVVLYRSGFHRPFLSNSHSLRRFHLLDKIFEFDSRIENGKIKISPEADEVLRKQSKKSELSFEWLQSNKLNDFSIMACFLYRKKHYCLRSMKLTRENSEREIKIFLDFETEDVELSINNDRGPFGVETPVREAHTRNPGFICGRN